MSKAQLAKFARERAERQARLVHRATLAQAVDLNVEAQMFCFWARLNVYTYGRITSVLRSYLDERCPGFAETVPADESMGLEEVSFWQELRGWIETHLFMQAVLEGWRDALEYYTAAHPRCKKATKHWLETKRALESETLMEVPLYELWRDQS